MKLSHKTSYIAAGLLASVSAAALLQVMATAQARLRVEAAIASTPGMHVRSVSVDPWSGRIALADVSAEAKGLKMVARRLVIAVPGRAIGAFIVPALAADDTVSADGLEFDIGIAKIHIPHLEAGGTSLTSDELKALVDPNDPESPSDRLAKLKAASIAIPDIGIDIAAGPVTEKVAYHDITLGDVAEGKIGKLSVGGASLSVSSPTMPAPLEGTIGALTATNLDLGLYAKILTTARTDANEPLAPLYDSISFDGLQMKSGDAFSLSVGKMTGSGIKGRPFTTSIADLKKMIPKTPQDKPSPEQTKTILAFVSDVYKSIEIGSFEVQGINVKVNDHGKDTAIGLDRFAMNGIANARFGEIAFGGFGVAAQDGHVKLGSFAIRGFDFGPTLAALQQVTPDDPNPLKNIDPRTLIPTLDEVVLGDVDADVPDARQKGNAEDGARDRFKIGKIQFDGSSYRLGVPTAASLAIEHVVADLPANDPSVKQFIALGYPSVDVSSKFAAAWNEPASELELKELSLTGAGMGSVKLSGVFGNVTKDVFVGDAAVMQAALLGAVVKAADVRVDNAGLLDKAFDSIAQSQHKSTAAFKSETIDEVSKGIPQLLGDSPTAKDIAAAITKFIAEPKSLEVSARSADGIGAGDFQQLSSPAALLARLSVTATAGD